MDEADRQMLVRGRASVKAALTVQEIFFSQFTIGSSKDHSQALPRLEYIKTINVIVIKFYIRNYNNKKFIPEDPRL